MSHQQGGRIPLLAALRQPRMLLAFFATRTHCWLTSSLVPTTTPKSFPPRLLSSQSAPSTPWCTGLFFPGGRGLRVHLLNLMRFLSSHLCSLSRSFWLGAQPTGILASSRSLCCLQACRGCTLSHYPGN